MRILLKIALIVSVFASVLTLKSQTIIPGGYVSGNWELGNSPFTIQDDILIHPDSTLEIGSGVQVLFSGPFMLEVQGQLRVSGTTSQPVMFDRANDTIQWHGIFFNTTDTSITDSSVLANGAISHCAQHPCLTISNSSRLRVSGFTIAYGEAFRGAGISCINSNPYFDDLLVQHNHSLDGAGISLENSSAVLKNSTITQNNADGAGGGIVIFNSGNPYFENCTFAENQSFGSGGGIYINDANPVFVRCNILENEGAIGGSNLYSGGGVSVKLGAHPFFGNCTFENNVSHRQGGAIASFSTNEIINCQFVTNSAGNFGGAVFLSSGNLIVSHLNNCTFSDNDSPQGTALATHNHTAVIRNCILWHSSPANPESLVHLDATFSWNVLNAGYSDIQNGQAGIELSENAHFIWSQGNIELDPDFLSGQPELNWMSPCIEAGTPDTSGLMLPEDDLAGNPRIMNARVDMGAFEYQLPLIIPNSSASHQIKIQNYLFVFPNPANDYVFLESHKKSAAGIIHLFNSSGQPIFSKNMNGGKMKIDLSGLPAGLYFIKIDGDKSYNSEKLIIQ